MLRMSVLCLAVRGMATPPGAGRLDPKEGTFFFGTRRALAYLSITGKQPLTAHDPIHPKVSSRQDP